jgi:preprotein translocase subunit SecY
MFRDFCKSFCSFLIFLPGVAASLFGLREAANRAGFEAQYPPTHQKLVNSLNYLIYILVEYALGYVIVCALAAFIWTLIVMEPKTQSKRKFEKRRLNLRS